ncbi:adenylyl cyclase CyaB, putative [Longilinea arvoryzae]|uniref:Adenylyl cyclase CyaB, putative n=1 Tax=Longilinea arvoryzae TaxID=360412 RepID=A0A0S7BFW0_9CHLR|nr:class IV adenylate cyclase [Longilinea arvoryzae]GAP12346.1 adenylyl cyclase CyaB, putative [Longilinea arvoryzae]
MNPKEQEIEVKFYVRDLAKVEQHLQKANASLKQKRMFETNLRFDTADTALGRQRRVLRLRRPAPGFTSDDPQGLLTYKGPTQSGQAISIRQEIEVVVSDFETAYHLLEALGYQLVVMYEKWRTVYVLDSVDIDLDQTPLGNFIEVEGPNTAKIQEVAQKLDLDWEARSGESYMALFNRVRLAKELTVQNLSFSELSGVEVGPQDMGLRSADDRYV